jgi:hypothetical protein
VIKSLLLFLCFAKLKLTVRCFAERRPFVPMVV